ncbi:two-component sensor histidine kinase, partial [Escherichia coli]|nr:two-component sensor histidine kinase [Escherichia coli]
RLMRQRILKKQLRTINFALNDGKPVDTESFVPEIQELERNIENMRERQKKLMQQEEQAQQARNDLITNVSHDLRTPLTSILGYLSYIHEDRYRDEIELRYYTELVYG